MYILTTSKRIKQITLLLVFLVTVVGLGTWFSWRSNHIVGPTRFIEKIRTTQQVKVNEVDIESIRAEFVSAIEKRLIEQLSASNIDQPAEAAKLMLPDAVDFLSKDKVLVNLINQQLKKLPKAENAWQKLSSASDRQMHRSLDKCLVIARVEGDWILQHIGACDPVDVTSQEVD